MACTLSESEYFESQAKNKDGTMSKRIVIIDNSKIPSLDPYQEKKDQNNEQICKIPDNRVVTVTPQAVRFFRSIGALQLCNHRYVTPYHEMLVFEELGKSYMKFDLN